MDEHVWCVYDIKQDLKLVYFDPVKTNQPIIKKLIGCKIIVLRKILTNLILKKKKKRKKTKYIFGTFKFEKKKIKD